MVKEGGGSESKSGKANLSAVELNGRVVGLTQWLAWLGP